MVDEQFSPDEIFRVLLEAQADFVVFGGLAAMAHEVGWSTMDVDILIATEDPNLIPWQRP